MSGYNEYNEIDNTNRLEERSSVTGIRHGAGAAALAAGALIALAGILPAAAQAQQSTTKHTHHATATHRRTAHRAHHTVASTSARRSAHPIAIVIHGYASSHPYSEQAMNEAAYSNLGYKINIHTATVSSSEMPAKRWYPEGHGAPGGMIYLNGTVGPDVPDYLPHPSVGVPDYADAPGYGTTPGIVQWPSYSFAGPTIDDYDANGNLISTAPVVTSPVVTVPVVPTTPVVPAPAVVPTTPSVPTTPTVPTPPAVPAVP